MTDKKMTRQQQKALHLWYTMLAEALNNAGCTIERSLPLMLDTRWTGLMIKELVWRPQQIIKFDKKSTTKITHDEMQELYLEICEGFAVALHADIPFPSLEEAMMQSLHKQIDNQ